ncbi:unnamed protein product [Phytophthora lilii]|uniref:Unnamed protein product n=1 Tax=Phytophthora lilii TaxID=2077276 RepID=A0A9W6XI02_9STRA|nr:unnamed protein product [Phytophthora lilii]
MSDTDPSPSPPVTVDLTVSPPSPDSAESTSPTTQAAEPYALLKTEAERLLGPPSGSSAAAASLIAPEASSSRPLTLAALERVLELRDLRLDFDHAEREKKLCKLLAYTFSKPSPTPSPELVRRIQGVSSIEDLVPAMEGSLVRWTAFWYRFISNQFQIHKCNAGTVVIISTMACNHHRRCHHVVQ